MKRAIKKLEKIKEKELRKIGLKGKNLLFRLRDELSAASPKFNLPTVETLMAARKRRK